MTLNFRICPADLQGGPLGSSEPRAVHRLRTGWASGSKDSFELSENAQLMEREMWPEIEG